MSLKHICWAEKSSKGSTQIFCNDKRDSNFSSKEVVFHILSFMSNMIAKRLMCRQVCGYKKLPRGFFKDEKWGSRVTSQTVTSKDCLRAACSKCNVN